MGTDIEVVSRGRNSIRRINAIQRRVEYPQRAWKSVGAYLSREVQKQFMTRGANFGTPWKPLAVSTVIQKRRAGFNTGPLVRTGAMRRGFIGRPMDHEVYKGHIAEYGLTSKIAKWQDGGTMRNGRRHIPPRTILKVTPKVRRDVKRILERHIKKGDV